MVCMLSNCKPKWTSPLLRCLLSSIWPQQQECHTLEIYIQLRHVDTSSKQVGEGVPAKVILIGREHRTIKGTLKTGEISILTPLTCPAPCFLTDGTSCWQATCVNSVLFLLFLQLEWRGNRVWISKRSYSVVTSSSVRVLVLSIRTVSAMWQKKVIYTVTNCFPPVSFFLYIFSPLVMSGVLMFSWLIHKVSYSVKMLNIYLG